MSGLPHIENSNIKDAFISGEPGTTGREPFDDSSATGPGRNFASGMTGTHSAPGTGLGHEHGLAGNHNNDNQHQHGIVDKLTAGSGHAQSHEHQGLTGAGRGDHMAGAGTQYGAGKHGTGGEVGLGGGGLTGAAGGAAAAVGSGVGHRDHGDRVGNVGQDSSRYEGDLHSGPRTGGAAGTERFDAPTAGSGAVDRQYADGVQQDTSQRAPGQKSGGLSGLLATSDKDFTGRDRQGKGAYADTDGAYANNQTGPAGNTALTGREGNLDKNPVTQATSHTHAPGTHEHGTPGTHGTTPATGAATGEAHAGEHKGFLQKVKDTVGL